MTAKKYFIAIVIPDPLFGEIEGIKGALFDQYNLKGALRSPSHITLHRPFEWKEEKEQDLIEKISGFRFRVPFTLELKDFAFFEPRVIYVHVLKNEILVQLHSQLKSFAQKELKLLNEINDLRGFHPHITVAFRDLKKPQFYELQKTFETKKLEAAFDYTGFSLLKLGKKWEVLTDFTSK